MVTEKVINVVEKSKELALRHNFNRAIKLLDETLDLTKDNEDLAMLHLAKGIILYMKHVPLKALDELREAAKYADSANNYKMLEDINKSISEIEKYVALLESSIENEKRMLENEEDEKNRGIYFNEIGTLYYYLGNREMAEENLNKALEIFRKLGENVAMAATLLNLGNVKEGIEALDCYYKALDILEEEGHLSGIADTYESLALYYWRDENWEEAYYFLKKEIEIIEELEKIEEKEEILRKYGDIYRMASDLALMLGKEDEALKWIEKISS